MKSIVNFRQLAANEKNKQGKIIKKHSVFRSGIISHATPEDISYLVKKGIKHIYDFRGKFEVVELPTIKHKHFKVIHYDIAQQAAPRSYARLRGLNGEQVREKMINRYATFFSSTKEYKPVIRSILRQETPEFLFHCSAGKDRTGIFGAIFMLALDFDIETIKKEFLIINQAQVNEMKNELLEDLGETGDMSHLDNLFTVLPEYFDAYSEAILKKYGDFDTYLNDIVGISIKHKEKLQKKYLINNGL